MGRKGKSVIYNLEVRWLSSVAGEIWGINPLTEYKEHKMSYCISGNLADDKDGYRYEYEYEDYGIQISKGGR